MMVDMNNTVGWSNGVLEPAFGAMGGGDASIKSKLINLMTSVRTLMRSMSILKYYTIEVQTKAWG